MALDNSLYDSVENTYFKLKEYLESTQLGREHSPMILKQEELGELLERLDIEAIEEQTKDINALHDQLDAIKSISDGIRADLQHITDSVTLSEKVVHDLEIVFDKINELIV